MRHPQILSKSSAILVVIDMQEPFLRPIFERDRVVRQVRLLMEAARALDVPTVATLQYAEKMGGCIPEIAELLPSGTPPFDKLAFSCADNEEFRLAVQSEGRSQILLCGIETHICVNQTAHDLLHAGYQVHIASDAVSSRSEFNSNQGLQRMAAAGAVITNAESALYEMLGRSGTTEFKRILPLVK